MPEDFADEPLDGEESDTEENFAEMLEAYGSGRDDHLQVGDKVTVKVIAITGDTVFVDTGTKIDGAVDKGDICDDNGQIPYKEGDSLELYVVEKSESEIRLSTAISGIGGLSILQDAYEDGIPVEGRVMETCKGGFRVELLKRRAFCPISQMDLKYVETPEDYIGQVHQFLIKQFEENGKNIVVSRRSLMEAEQKKAHDTFLADVHNGDILAGTVTRIMPYGAFVALAPGLEGMVHISELSWSRVKNAEEVVAIGDPVKARLIGIETDEKKGRLKMSLSMKQVQDNPWESVEDKFKVGDMHTGRVTRCMDFGAFVEIAPGIEGLVHVSEMSYVRRVNKAEDVVTPDEEVSVVIKEILPGQRRISLSMRDAQGDPWVGVQKKYTAGQRVQGVVQKRETFGIFVTLEPGITGLLHKSKISRSANASAIDKTRPGDPIQVVVESVLPAERKISLTVGDAADEGDWKNYAPDSPNTMGTLGEQLQQALANKK